MNNESENLEPESGEEFGLKRPSGLVSVAHSGERLEAPDESRIMTSVPNDPSLPTSGWRGLEEDDDDDGDDEDKVDFGQGSFKSEGDMDMTPMVDVTFLLLIFFMVTAAFSLMRTLEQPKPQVDEPSETVVTPPEEDQKDYVEVIIDQNNSYFVSDRGAEEIEAPSDNEMRAMIQNAKNDFGTEKLLITAHVDSFHEKFVTVWDAGQAAGMTIQSRTTEEEY